jgi:ATP-dependent Clp protease protease subunit
MENPTWVSVYNRMYRERIMFLNNVVDDDVANQIIAVLLYLESEDANSPVGMYFNVPGGIMKSGLAMYDTMRIMPYDIQSVNMGMCAQIAAFLVAGGTKGKRYALPNSRFAMQNPVIMQRLDEKGNVRQRIMQATEMQLEVEEVMRDQKRSEPRPDALID